MQPEVKDTCFAAGNSYEMQCCIAGPKKQKERKEDTCLNTTSLSSMEERRNKFDKTVIYHSVVAN